MKKKIPSLPKLLARKLYKTGQTRGADDDVIYQNRVLRNNTVLIPFQIWNKCRYPYRTGENYENGFIVLISPKEFFRRGAESKLKEAELKVGHNALVFYETRQDWEDFNPRDQGWFPASSRKPPLNGNYVARVPATTSRSGGAKVFEGYNTTSTKGAGIRVYEYASKTKIKDCRLQLEAIFWQCADALDSARKNGMEPEEARRRKSTIESLAEEVGLLNLDSLVAARMLNRHHQAICPLCLEPLSGKEFFARVRQATGREVGNLTVTQVNLFHIKELNPGDMNHIPYNVAWGHHHCNTVVRDVGIHATLNWMIDTINSNKNAGFID